MYSGYRWIGIVAVLLASCAAWASEPDLWVCADANNLPYSNQQEQGFENKLAQMIARDLGRNLKYVWWPASPRFARKVFRSGACDLIMGVPSQGYDLALPTRPYYRSSYVFVSRQDHHLHIQSFDDPALRTTRIALPVVDDGFTPAAQELAARGLVSNVVGYSPFGNLSKPNQPAELIRAVAKGDVDLAIAWGPLAGYFAKDSEVPLDLTPICSERRAGSPPMEFSISIGVRPGEPAMVGQLDAEVARRLSEIQVLLASYGIPVIAEDSDRRTCP
jgi:mxaJ protein